MKIKIYSVFIFIMLLALTAGSEAASNITISPLTGGSAAVSPASGATGVALNTQISFTISGDSGSYTLTCGSVNAANVSIHDINSNPVSISSISCSSKTATITLSSNLTDCMSYTVTVKSGATGIKDSNGLTMSSDKTWSFTTIKVAPTVVSTVPANGATGVLQTSNLIATFSEPMTASTITTSTFVLTCSSVTQTGTVSLDGTNEIATFVPSANLPSGSSCTASITTGAKNQDNPLYCSGAPTPLAATYSWNFTVRDYIAPAIVSVSPADGSIGIAVNSTVTATFSEMVATATIKSANFFLQDPSGTTVAAAVTLDPTQKIATLTPSANLGYNTAYTATMTTGVTDLAGNNMVANKTWAFTTAAPPMATYCNVPPFISAPVAPNVLIILDNSNSMDEDLMGNAVGSFASNSKSVIARKALINIINTYANQMDIGIMTYSLPSVSSATLANSAYFSSYDPRSYCPFPPSQCLRWCQTGSASSQNTCRTTCQAQNPLFDETYFDPVISNRAIGDATRNKYCSLIYPKTIQVQNPTDSTNFLYYAQALPGYNFLNSGSLFLYSSNYNWSQELTSIAATNYSYSAYTSKTGSSDANSGYSGLQWTNAVEPTDSDLAAGYGNFGQRNFMYYVGQTWFANSSPGGGFLQVTPAVNNPSNNTQLTALLNKLTTNEDTNPSNTKCANSGSSTPCAYMSCTNTGNPNACSYIVNAGLTPTAGTLQTATNLFTGASSPIQYRCQKNFIIYVTDGMPDTTETGGTDTSANLMNTVLTKITNLRSITKTLNGTSYPFDVKSYILGVGMTSAAQTNLNSMAVAGGTATSNGAAYYANNSSALQAALSDIFQNILDRVSSGTAASVLASSEGSGANLIQAIFYPQRLFLSTSVNWIGTLQNYWYYLDPNLNTNSIREDTVPDSKMVLNQDYQIQFYFDQTQVRTMATRTQTDSNGNFVSTQPSEFLEDLNNLWEAGRVLWATAPSSRTIITTTTETYPSTLNFTADAATAAKLQPYLQAASGSGEAEAIIRYVRGEDTVAGGGFSPPTALPFTQTYRSRTTGIDLNNDNDTAQTSVDTGKGVYSEAPKVWKLGDIVNSTPKILSWVPLHNYDQKYNDGSYAAYYGSTNYVKRNLVFTGANDGMLHAFKLGLLQINNDGSGWKATLCNDANNNGVCDAGETSSANLGILGSEQWAYIPKGALPYLKYMADPNYCHLYYVDATPVVFDASINMTTDCSGAGISNYWQCPKQTKLNNDGSLNLANTSWRTVLIGGMRLGGACKDAGSANGVQTPVPNKGYSSYFALDITDSANPVLLWEFSNEQIPAADKGLGFATSGPAIIRISDRTTTGCTGSGVSCPVLDGTGASKDNGKWFVVFASGPTGPIDTTTHQFLGNSDQDLRLYILDLKTGNLLRTIDTGIQQAFGGSMINGCIDYDNDYQDDACYLGYTKYDGSTTKWTQGGALRLITRSNLQGANLVGGGYTDSTGTQSPSGGDTALNPKNWLWGYVADNIGPVTSAVSHLAYYPTGETTPSKAFLYFGTGRYFFKTTSGVDDGDPTTQRAIFAMQEPCMNNPSNGRSMLKFTSVAPVSSNSCFDTSTSQTICSLVSSGDVVDNGSHSCLYNSTLTQVTTLPANAYGWYINLAAPSGNFLAERVITDPLATYLGGIFFTTFSPSTDVCDYGGSTYLWGLRYDTGGSLGGSIQGKALIQVSTGAIVEIPLATAFTDQGSRRASGSPGSPPAGPPPALVVKPAGIDKILQIQKK